MLYFVVTWLTVNWMAASTLLTCSLPVGSTSQPFPLPFLMLAKVMSAMELRQIVPLKAQ